jgi:hypothetical protein
MQASGILALCGILVAILLFAGGLFAFFSTYGPDPFAGGPSLAGPDFDRWQATAFAKTRLRKRLWWMGFVLLCVGSTLGIIVAIALWLGG